MLLASLILLAAANFIGAPLWAVTLAAAAALVAGNWWQHYLRPWWLRRRKVRRPLTWLSPRLEKRMRCSDGYQQADACSPSASLVRATVQWLLCSPAQPEESIWCQSMFSGAAHT